MLALADFNRCGFADAHTGPVTQLNVAVWLRQRRAIGKVRAWLDNKGRSPRQQALKVRLRDVLESA